MSYTQNGIGEITKGNYKNAFSILEKGFFEEGETSAGCYLAQMYYDERITPRTEESNAAAMLLWYVTADEVASSKHKLGVSLFSLPGKAKNIGLDYIKEAAKKEYPVSFCVLGVLAYHDNDFATAIDYFSKYQNIENDKKALLMYAESCCKIDIPDYKKAEELYTLCAEKYKDSDAYLKLSKYYSTPRVYDGKKRFAYAEKAAELGDVDAAKDVGVAYFVGNEFIKENPIKNLDKAYKFLDYAYKKKNGEAAAYLGDMYSQGLIVQKDEKKALELYDDAINLGYVQGYDKKGMYYYFSRNYHDAYINFKKLNYDESNIYSSMMFECAYNLYSNVPEKENELVKIAINCQNYGGNVPDTAHLVLGKAYYDGKYLIRDFDMAVFHLKNCVSHLEANYIIGKLAAYGAIESITPAESEAYLLVAANAGVGDAMLVLGKLYKQWQQASKAVSMLMKAYSKGVKEAAREISEMYLNGDVTGRKDKKKAKEWSEKAK